MKKLLSVIVLLFCSLNFVHAQTYSPDRPGIGNGSFITPEGIFGVEAGLDFRTNDFVNQFNIGQVLLRIGVMENLELRAGLGSFSSRKVELIGSSVTNSGLQDVSIGAKYNFLSKEGQPNVSGMVNISLPVGDDAFTSDEVVPSLTVLADHSLNEDVSISSNLGYSFGVGDLRDSWLFTLTPGFSLDDNMGVYGGYAGRYYGDGINQNWLEAGFTYRLETEAQLDANLGYETEGETFFIGIGFAKGF